MAPFSKLNSSVAVLVLLLLLIMSPLMAIAAQSNFKHGRKLFQNLPEPYSTTTGTGGYVPKPYAPYPPRA
ncbi:hypothetical protein P8452_28036 [Trifolium repens]|nr:hypothetical protein P8452_28036 [Trifolium repens]